MHLGRVSCCALGLSMEEEEKKLKKKEMEKRGDGIGDRCRGCPVALLT